MLNVYSFEKKLQQFKDLQKAEKSEQKWREKYVKEREKMADNYKKRIDKFIYDMYEMPIVVKDHVNSRETEGAIKEDRSKMLGEAVIRTKSFKTERDRIKETLEHNKFKYSTYYDEAEEGCKNFKLKDTQLRTRDPTKDINPGMRFTAKTGLERVMDAIKSNGSIDEQNLKKGNGRAKSQNSKQSPANSKRDDIAMDGTKVTRQNSMGNDTQQQNATTETHKNMFMDMSMMSTTRNEQLMLMTNELAKKVHSDLHMKTHFKAVQDVVIQQQPSLKNRFIFKDSMNMADHLAAMQAIKPQELVDEFKEPNPNRAKEVKSSSRKKFHNEEFMLSGRFKKSHSSKQLAESLSLPSLALNSKHLNPLQLKSQNPLKIQTDHLGGDSNSYKAVEFLMKHRALSPLPSTEVVKKIRFSDMVTESLASKFPETEIIKKGGVLLRKDKTDQLAKEVLVMCNVFHKKSDKSDVMLKSGYGKLISSYESNNKTIYKILDKSLQTQQNFYTSTPHIKESRALGASR